MLAKKYKYNIVHVSSAGEQLIESFVRLRDAKRYVEIFPNLKQYIIPSHDVQYYIEYTGRVFLKRDRRLP